MIYIKDQRQRWEVLWPDDIKWLNTHNIKYEVFWIDKYTTSLDWAWLKSPECWVHIFKQNMPEEYYDVPPVKYDWR